MVITEVYPGVFQISKSGSDACTDEELDQIIQECEQILAQAMTHAG